MAQNWQLYLWVGLLMQSTIVVELLTEYNCILKATISIVYTYYRNSYKVVM